MSKNYLSSSEPRSSEEIDQPSQVSCRLAISRRHDYKRSRVQRTRDETMLIIAEVKHQSFVKTSYFDQIMGLTTGSESQTVAMQESTEAKQF